MAITSNPTIQNGALLTAQGQKTFFNITTPTVVKTTAGRIAKINVLVAGSTNGSINDAATTGLGFCQEVAPISRAPKRQREDRVIPEKKKGRRKVIHTSTFKE